MRLGHFYHIYAGPGWEPIVSEHMDLVIASGLADELKHVSIGVVGPEEQRQKAISYCESRMPTVVVAQADTGWEHVTIGTVASFADEWDAVLYAHTKGVAHLPGGTGDYPGRRAWRWAMNETVITRWRECVLELENNEAVGGHWLTPEVWPGAIQTPFFGGNFWWARSDLIKRTKCIDPNRFCHTCGVGGNCGHGAELWIGDVDPRPVVFDFRPGWPLYTGGQYGGQGT